MWDFLNLPGVMPTLIAALTWAGHKLLGKRADTKAGKVASAIAEASARMLQQAIEAPPNRTKDQMIIAFKGTVAICLAKIGVTERDREPYQAMIDHAIAVAVTRWMERG
jgi:threonine/homoserine efflux transporter RhtA